jgi:hypothetical protein
VAVGAGGAGESAGGELGGAGAVSAGPHAPVQTRRSSQRRMTED